MAENGNKTGSISLMILRVVLGIIFAYHGYLKLFVPGGFKGTVDFFTLVGIYVPRFSALFVSLLEFVGGLLLIIGFLVRLVSVLLVFEMFVAFFAVHMRNGFVVSKGGYEFVLVLLASLFMIVANGAGRLTVKSLFSKEKKED